MKRTSFPAAGILAVVVVLAAAACSKSNPQPAQTRVPPSRSSAAPSGDATSAGCLPVKTIPPFNPASQDRWHIGTPPITSPPPLSKYSSTPPASGPHLPVPLDAGVYGDPPDVYATIHSLEHGAVIVWLAPEAVPFAGSTIFKDPAIIDHVVVAPYDYPDQGKAGALPAGTQMALVAWHHLQLCSSASEGAVRAFLSSYRFPTLGGGPYLGDAPEQGLAI